MKSTFLCCLISLLTSCSTVKYIDVEMRKPAQVTIPSEIKKIAIVNNAASQPYGVGHQKVVGLDSLTAIVSSDSLNIILTQAIAQFVEEEAFFDTVVWYNKELRSDSLFLTQTLIDSLTLKNIFLETGADMIFSLDQLSLSSKQHFLVVDRKKHEKQICVNIVALFRMYLPRISEPFGPVSYGDRVCWERYWGEKEALPSAKTLLRRITLRAADKMTSAMIPSWKTEEREYYTDASSPMKKASMKASANEWGEAAKIWGELFDAEEKDNKKGKLAVNIALANEMLDDVENAITWIDIAIEYFTPTQQGKVSEDLTYAKSQKKSLESRLSDFKLLDLQIGVSK